MIPFGLVEIPHRWYRASGGERTMPKKPVSAKIDKMIAEGYKPTVAAAAAHSMARKGQLGPKGGYERRTGRPRGPRGRQRGEPSS